MLTTCRTEGKSTLAAGAVQAGLWKLEFAEGAGSERLWFVFCFDRTASDGLDLGLELGRDLFHVFRSDQDTGPSISYLFELGLVTLADCGGHDVGHVVRELADVLANTIQQTSRANVVTHFDESF